MQYSCFVVANRPARVWAAGGTRQVIAVFFLGNSDFIDKHQAHFTSIRLKWWNTRDWRRYIQGHWRDPNDDKHLTLQVVIRWASIEWLWAFTLCVLGMYDNLFGLKLKEDRTWDTTALICQGPSVAFRSDLLPPFQNSNQSKHLRASALRGEPTGGDNAAT